jgi:hypothetical protein
MRIPTQMIAATGATTTVVATARASSPRPLRRRCLLFAGAWVASGVIGSGTAHAWPAGTVPRAQRPSSVAAGPSAATSAPGPSSPAAAPAPTSAPTKAATAPAATSTKPALDVAGALARAHAAYEYGDIDEMVESARQVADGRLHPSPAERANALRYLGIGLFLTGRAEGAETAFFELLRLRPDSRLDPHTTRPDAVAFFEQVRLRYAEPIRDAARANNRKVFAWNFLPPAGQLQNGNTTTAITIGSIELVSLGTAIATFALLKHWEGPHNTFPGRADQASLMQKVNWTSVGVLSIAFLVGVVDGIVHYGDPQDDAPATASATSAGRLSINPDGIAFAF